MCHHKIMIMDSFELKKITHKIFNSSNVTTITKTLLLLLFLIPNLTLLISLLISFTQHQ